MKLNENDVVETHCSHDASVKCYEVPVTNKILKKALKEYLGELNNRIDSMTKAYDLLIRRRADTLTLLGTLREGV